MDNFLAEIRQLEQGDSIQTTLAFAGFRKLTTASTLPYKVFKPSIWMKVFVLLFLTAFLAVPLSRTFDPKPITNSQLGGLILA